MHTSPFATVNAFVAAMNRGDIDAAIAHYEPHAMLVAEPGALATGTAAIREALQAMLAGRPSLSTGAHEVLVAGDIALFHAHWTLSATGPDGLPMTLAGQSSDVLRRQPGGEWKIAIDNPWGTALLQPATQAPVPA